MPELFGNTVEQLVIKDNPICSSASIEMLKAYSIATMPSLVSFNGAPISAADRRISEECFSHLLNVRKSVSDNRFARGNRTELTQCNERSQSYSGNDRKRRNMWGLNRSVPSSDMRRNWVDGQHRAGRASGSQYLGTGNNELVSAVDAGRSEVDTPLFTQNALYRREVTCDFDVFFEKAVQSVVFEALKTLKPPGSL